MSIPIITTPAGSEWSTEEAKLLRKLYNTMTPKQLTRYLPGRTASAISARAHKMGLVRHVVKSDYWRTPEGLERLTLLMATHTQGGVAQLIGISPSTLSMWVARYADIAEATRKGRHIKEQKDKPKPRPKLKKKQKPNEPQHKCVGCEWAKRLVKSGSQVLCMWPTGCDKEEGEL